MISKALLVVFMLAWASSVYSASPFEIGYLQLKGDQRYSRKVSFARYLMQAQGRPYAGAKLALKEVAFHGSKAGVEFGLKRIKASNEAELARLVENAIDDGVQHFIADLPAESLTALSQQLHAKKALIYNISERDNTLRQEHCHANLLHILPSYAMLTDALAQYLTSKKWRKVLLLEGPEKEDIAFARSFERSAKRFGLQILEKRPFIFGSNPRERHKNNIALLTTGKNYQLVMVADTNGEFARDVPYQTLQPQLVVGSEGLAALAWHWSWERHGAPQLEKRFEKAARRPMGSFDWAAWMAVKVIAEAVQRTASADFNTLNRYIKSDELILDTFKGNRSNFRPWNNQLRQPILLATHNWVVERAPIQGFLHQRNNLDSIGLDENEVSCRF